MVNEVKNSALGHLLEIKKERKTNMTLHYLLVLQIQANAIPLNELWFLVGGRFIKFSAKKFALITGLWFGKSNFQYHDKKCKKPHSRSLFYTHFNRKNVNKLRLTMLCADFSAKNLDCTESYIKAALLIICYLTVLCRDNCSIDSWAWHLVEDYERWNAYPWGQTQCWCYRLTLNMLDRH